tara:strand:- start:694 stop:900 length:207 start_codon:yes stop_codon:yes gene_type:complete
MFLGPDLIPFLLLALGAALVVGNGLAMIKPRLEPRTEKELSRAPVGRSLLMIAIGMIVSIWALATLVG